MEKKGLGCSNPLNMGTKRQESSFGMQLLFEIDQQSG